MCHGADRRSSWWMMRRWPFCGVMFENLSHRGGGVWAGVFASTDPSGRPPAVTMRPPNCILLLRIIMHFIIFYIDRVQLFYVPIYTLMAENPARVLFQGGAK